MSDPRDALQRALGDGYVIERELGGGSLSRVFLAEERALKRKVVVKMLAADALHAVNVERFRREVQLTAALQHPHIVPVLGAGEADGVPFYTMPFVNGLSLRGRLAAGPVSIADAVGILREIARALAYAHANGVVHRDIKPENIMLSGGTVVVTDFGIAKAITAASSHPSDPSLTAIGMTVGTPAYMAPEQATGDRGVDARTDIYGFGCVAYELLAGRPPFVAPSAQELLVAQLTEPPVPVERLRPDTPRPLASLVMACLEKYPALRPQSASSLVELLGSALVERPDTDPQVPAIAGDAERRATSERAPLSTLEMLGMTPDQLQRTVSAETPAVAPRTVTGTVDRVDTVDTVPTVPERRVERTEERVGHAAAPRPRRSRAGAWLAVVALVIAVAYGAFRLAGGSLTLRTDFGLADNARVIIADFRAPATDSTLGPAVAEAFRAGLSQSDAVRVVQPAQILPTLRRMQLRPGAAFDFPLARQVAQRDGIEAVIDGGVVQIGSEYVVNVTMYNATTAEALATFTSRAKNLDGLLDAVESVVRDVRTGIGESLARVNDTPPLERVTTPSIEALRKYTQAMRVLNQTGNRQRGIALLEEAIALDTGFAMAYRRLAVELNNAGMFRARAVEALAKAYAHRDRLSEVERQLTIAGYYTTGPEPDMRKALAAYEAVMELAPNSPAGFNNGATMLRELRQFARAESLAARGLRIDSAGVQLPWHNLFVTQLVQGKVEQADSTLQRFARNMPRAAMRHFDRAMLQWNQRAFDSLNAGLDRLRAERQGDNTILSELEAMRAATFAVQGRFAEAQRAMADKERAERALGDSASSTYAVINVAQWEAVALGRPDRALAVLDSALRVYPLASRPVPERPHAALAMTYALLGRADRVRPIVADFEASKRTFRTAGDARDRALLQGALALAEKRYDDAARAFKTGDQGSCVACYLPWIALSYDQGGNADSAAHYFARYLAAYDAHRYNVDQVMLAPAHARLAELLEARGDFAGAARNYDAFIALWRNADRPAQPRVAAARAGVVRARGRVKQ